MRQHREDFLKPAFEVEVEVQSNTHTHTLTHAHTQPLKALHMRKNIHSKTHNARQKSIRDRQQQLNKCCCPSALGAQSRINDLTSKLLTSSISLLTLHQPTHPTRKVLPSLADCWLFDELTYLFCLTLLLEFFA